MLWSSSPTAKSAGRARRPGEHLQPGVLQPVRVLELVDQDVAEAPLVVLAQRLRCRASARRCAASARRSRRRPRAGTAPRRPRRPARGRALCSSLDLDVLRPQAVVLRAGDRPRDLLRHVALLVEVHRLDDALDGRELVARVEDLEALRQRRRASSARAGSGCRGRGRCRPTCRARGSASIAPSRVSISFAALFVKVTASTPAGESWPVWISQAMRVVSTRVLPEPAPARISAGRAGRVTAASCSGLSPRSRREGRSTTGDGFTRPF